MKRNSRFELSPDFPEWENLMEEYEVAKTIEKVGEQFRAEELTKCKMRKFSLKQEEKGNSFRLYIARKRLFYLFLR